jgi:transposase
MRSAKSRQRSSSAKAIKTSEFDNLQQLNLNAAGLDIGASEIYVCVPSGRDEHCVKVFSTFTADLYALADWLQQCGVTTVAMESTGVYWIPCFQILEQRGFEVYLVNATQVKNVPGRKSDVLDCQWLQQLHSYGLLRHSFRPDEQTCVLRSLVRHRQMLLRSRASHIQHMQKALQQMNVQLMQVVGDISGTTGLRIIRDIVSGNHNPTQLAKHRDCRCAKSEAEIAKALQGDYRLEHLFVLRQALELFDFYTQQVQTCDTQIEAVLSQLPQSSETELPPPARRGGKAKNQPNYDLRTYLYQCLGVDLTAVPGLDVLSVQTILSEIGTDMSKWATVKHFTAWLGLCPRPDKSGGKVLRSHTTKTKNRANLAFRQAAAALQHSHSALGQFYRRMRTKLGTPKAITAGAHKLARIVYHLLKERVPYEAIPTAQADAQYRERMLKQLQRKAQQFGAKLVLDSSEQDTSSPSETQAAIGVS